LQTPLPPPGYLTNDGTPHEHGICIQKSPLCRRCNQRSESHAWLAEQGRPPPTSDICEASLSQSPSVSCLISLFNPLESRSTDKHRDTLKAVSLENGGVKPPWMKLLPSNINADVHPPKHSVLQHRPSFPYIEHTRYSSPFSTPPEHRKDSDVQAKDLSKALQSLPQRQRTIAHGRRARTTSRKQIASRLRGVAFEISLGRAQDPRPTRDFTLSSPPNLSLTKVEELPPSSVDETPPTSPFDSYRLAEADSPVTVMKKDVLALRGKNEALKRRLTKHLEVGATEHALQNSPPDGKRPIVAPVSAKPTFLTELSSFFASRAGK
jgi:hypothetical protein